jgi:hypothetical protein
MLANSLANSLNLKMEARCPSETIMKHYIPEDRILQFLITINNHLYENLKSYKEIFITTSTINGGPVKKFPHMQLCSENLWPVQ